MQDTFWSKTGIERGIRKAIGPPPFPERIDMRKTRVVRIVRLVAVSLAILSDIFLVFGFRDSVHFEEDVLRTVGTFNIPLLVADWLVAFFLMKRRHRFYLTLSFFVLGVEITTAVVWIHLTGSISSYMLMYLCTIIVGMRLLGSYGEGLFTCLFALVLHGAVVFLEIENVLPVAPAIAGDLSLFYSLSHASEFVYFFIGVTAMFLFAFITSNLAVYHLGSMREALDDAEQHLAKVAEGARHGRLTARVLDDSYIILELVGRGGMGEVYRALRQSDQAECAIKVLHPHLAEDATALERFRREAEAVSRIPSVVTPELLDVCMSPENVEKYIVLEYLQGEDLAAKLRRERLLALDEIADIVSQIATALQRAHNAGIVHRDLKPQNIFLQRVQTGTARVRLLDFGISRIIESDTTLTGTQAILGTPGFMAPEQLFGGAHNAGPQADIFALGAITYQLLTGERPFVATQMMEAADEIMNRTPSPPSKHRASLRPQIDRVVLKALSKVPEARHGTALDFNADLMESLGRSVVSSSASDVVSVQDQNVDTEIDADG